MLSANQWQTFNTLISDLDTTQRQWLSRYLAELPTAAAQGASTQGGAAEIKVVYGSQGGNGKQIAATLTEMLAAAGMTARIVSLSDYKTAWLKKEQRLLIVISTHGEGEPPDDAKGFYDFLMSKRAPKLPQLSYATLALGDSSYDLFCHTGREVDDRLQALGATPLLARVECDTDYEQPAEKWQRAVLDALAQEQGQEANGGNGSSVQDFSALLPAADAMTLPSAKKVTRAHPFTSEIIDSIVLTTPPRRTLHLALSLEESNIQYQPGDSIGIRPHNPPALVEKTAKALGVAASDEITVDGDTATVQQWLEQRLDISRPTATTLRRYQKVIGNAALAALLEDKDATAQYINGRDFADVFADYPPAADAPPDAILACLRGLAPRLYSLASSPTLNEDEAHLLVAVDDYTAHDNALRHGICSQYLATLQPGDTVQLYPQENEKFRLPHNDDTPIIMIGPGTGVAPFRAFMEEREARGASGSNWLFFGNRHRRDEFYYQTEWQGYQKNGILTRLDVAFSRDGAQRIYVQDKLRQRADDIGQWLRDDAHIYVCGSTQMAADVHDQLAEIAAAHHGGDGGAYLQQMQADGRYQRDVY